MLPESKSFWYWKSPSCMGLKSKVINMNALVIPESICKMGRRNAVWVKRKHLSAYVLGDLLCLTSPWRTKNFTKLKTTGIKTLSSWKCLLYLKFFRESMKDCYDNTRKEDIPDVFGCLLDAKSIPSWTCSLPNLTAECSLFLCTTPSYFWNISSGIKSSPLDL